MNTQTEATWIEEAMRLALDARWLDVPGEQGAAGAKLRAHLATRPAAPDAKDAARYRWLRDSSVPPHNFYLSVPIEFDGVRYTSAEVDSTIDAAMIAAATGSTK